MKFVRSAIIAACTLWVANPSYARSGFWSDFTFRGDYHQNKSTHRHKETKPDFAKSAQSESLPKGPLQIIISIQEQRISVYENGALIARSAVSTGVKGHPTPFGVFSVLSKEKWHRSNIYSNAPMPYMQRITWSGIALHAGDLPGYPASHGCIRLTHDFAIRLWHLAKRGTRVIIARDELRPVEVENPRLFLMKSTAHSSVEPGTATVTNAGPVAVTATDNPGATAQASVQPLAPDSLAIRPKKVEPISIFVSRKLGKLFVRQGFMPLFDVPVKIQSPDEPIGTHVFEATGLQNAGGTIRWTVVTIPEKSGSATLHDSHNRLTKRAIETVSEKAEKANAAFNRIEIPQDAIEKISTSLTSGSSLIISDHGISDETGIDTGFIVLTR